MSPSSHSFQPRLETCAKRLMAGMRVQNPDGTWSVVQANTYEARDEGVTVYNFEVEGGHTYFVADDQGDVSAVWVHNSCSGKHHLIPKRFGSPIPYKSSKLTYYTASHHTRLHKALDKYLFSEHRWKSNTSGATIRAALTPQKRIQLLDDYYRDFSKGHYYKKFQAELREVIRRGGLKF